jgi:tRNA uridine 5-carboxymethylaminomethyl modification enzyme
MRFAEEWRHQLEQIENLDMFQDSVNSLLFEGNKIIGVKTALGIEIKSKTVVVTAGTFLNGLIHIGEKTFGGGRAGESASTGITEDLVLRGFESGRMKTGTPPRVDARSLDYSKMIEQPGDEHPAKFSYLMEIEPLKEQRSCYMTYTSQEVHDLLRIGFDRSPMFNGRIQSTGPRYCPSIEDKIDRFASKDRHQIFVEPEGWNTNEIYVNGFSTSLPDDIQDMALRKVAGFENVKFFRYGYAIEYDYFPPTQLKHSLETKIIENLFFAGQINGTTGYEEAGAQGLMAGINAALKTQNKDPFVLQRNEAYIGVLIDDLITKGTDEPYRMFTSRAEYRTLLRQDNADLRLTEKGFKLGLASQARLDRVRVKQAMTDAFVKFLNDTSIRPEEINDVLISKGTAVITQPLKMIRIASRPQITFADLEAVASFREFISENSIDVEVAEQAEILIKYSGYINKERNNADKLNRLENVKIPDGFDYEKLQAVSIEAKQKLTKIRPVTIAQASRISGVSPSDVSVLLVYMGR